MKEKSIEKLKLILKIIISFSLIFYIIYTIGPYRILDHIIKIDRFYFSISIFLTVINVLLSSKKWQVLLRAKGEKQNFLNVCKLYYIGTFFNMFLPTNVGGDIIKAHKMSKISKKSIEAYSSVFMERFLGLIAIISLATISTTLYFGELPKRVIVLIYSVFLPLIFISTSLILWKKITVHLENFLKSLFGRFNPFSLKERSTKILRSINEYAEKKEALIKALSISLIFHIVLILSYYIIGLSININISLYHFFIIIPITHILLFLPISIRGIGVREVLYAYFFTQVGATGAQAVSLSLLVQLLGVISSIIGGFIYLHSKIKKMKEI